jgi:hypothetical protein
MSADLIAAGLQLTRSFNEFNNHLFPQGNLPAQVAEFLTLSSSLLNGLTLIAAAGTQFRITVTVHLIDSSPSGCHHAAWPASPASLFPAYRTT